MTAEIVIRKAGILGLVMLLTLTVYAQQVGPVPAEDTASVTLTESIRIEGQDFPYMPIQNVNVVAYNFRTNGEKRDFYILRERIKKVYPYLKIAKGILTDIDSVKANEKKRVAKKYKKSRLKDEKKELVTQLKNLSRSNGKVLVKLIQRETDNNCYTIIKELKGGLAASMWQMIGKRYGYDLKAPYYPKWDENRILEYAINDLQRSGFYEYGISN